MKKILSVLSFLVLVAGVSAFAQSYAVTYSDGTVELKTTTGWTALSVGDSVPANGSVRVSQSGSLELTRGTSKITILRDGTYDITALGRAAAQNPVSGAGARISQKVQSLTKAKPGTAAVGGVRATEQSNRTVEWVDEEDGVRGRIGSLMAEKKYLDAAKELQKALDESPSPADQQEFTYLTGVAYYGAGQPAKAYRALSQVSPDPSVQWYARYILLKAQLLVESADYSSALSILQPVLSENPSGEPAQVAWLLTYYCQEGLGDAAAAKAALDAGYTVDPSSDTAKLIDQQRQPR